MRLEWSTYKLRVQVSNGQSSLIPPDLLMPSNSGNPGPSAAQAKGVFEVAPTVSRRMSPLYTIWHICWFNIKISSIMLSSICKGLLDGETTMSHCYRLHDLSLFLILDATVCALAILNLLSPVNSSWKSVGWDLHVCMWQAENCEPATANQCLLTNKCSVVKDI